MKQTLPLPFVCFWLIFSTVLLLTSAAHKIHHHYSLQSFLRVGLFTLVEITEWKRWKKFCERVLIKGTLIEAFRRCFWYKPLRFAKPDYSLKTSKSCLKHLYLDWLQKTQLHSRSTNIQIALHLPKPGRVGHLTSKPCFHWSRYTVWAMTKLQWALLASR